MFGKSQPKVSKVIHLEIAYNLGEIASWIEGDYSGDLLEKDKQVAWNHESDGGIIKYHFDLLPHPNGIDSLFFHQHVGAFSNNFEAVDYLGSSTLQIKNVLGKNVFAETEKKIYGVEWDLHRLGFLRLMVIPTKGDDARRLALIIPTSDIYQLHLGNTLNHINSYNLKDYSDEIITVNEDEAIGKVYRSMPPLTSGKFVSYYNSLCRVKAYLPGPLMLYDQYKKN